MSPDRQRLPCLMPHVQVGLRASCPAPATNHQALGEVVEDDGVDARPEAFGVDAQLACQFAL